MNHDIKNYLRVYPDFLTKEFCRDTVAQLDKADWQFHVYHDAVTNKTIQTENELSVTYDNIPNKTELDNKIWFAIRNYIDDALLKDCPWYGSWSGYSLTRINKYATGTNMKVHCDHISSLFDGQRKGIPILTVLGGLNDSNEYEGGKLVFWEEVEIDLPAGAVMVFPSNFLYPHKVTMVTKGTRYSYVSWVW